MSTILIDIENDIKDAYIIYQQGNQIIVDADFYNTKVNSVFCRNGECSCINSSEYPEELSDYLPFFGLTYAEAVDYANKYKCKLSFITNDNGDLQVVTPQYHFPISIRDVLKCSFLDMMSVIEAQFSFASVLIAIPALFNEIQSQQFRNLISEICRYNVTFVSKEQYYFYYANTFPDDECVIIDIDTFQTNMVYVGESIESLEVSSRPDLSLHSIFKRLCFFLSSQYPAIKLSGYTESSLYSIMKKSNLTRIDNDIFNVDITPFAVIVNGNNTSQWKLRVDVDFIQLWESLSSFISQFIMSKSDITTVFLFGKQCIKSMCESICEEYNISLECAEFGNPILEGLNAYLDSVSQEDTYPNLPLPQTLLSELSIEPIKVSDRTVINPEPVPSIDVSPLSQSMNNPHEEFHALSTDTTSVNVSLIPNQIQIVTTDLSCVSEPDVVQSYFPTGTAIRNSLDTTQRNQSAMQAFPSGPAYTNVEPSNEYGILPIHPSIILPSMDFSSEAEVSAIPNFLTASTLQNNLANSQRNQFQVIQAAPTFQTGTAIRNGLDSSRTHQVITPHFRPVSEIHNNVNSTNVKDSQATRTSLPSLTSHSNTRGKQPNNEYKSDTPIHINPVGLGPSHISQHNSDTSNSPLLYISTDNINTSEECNPCGQPIFAHVSNTNDKSQKPEVNTVYQKESSQHNSFPVKLQSNFDFSIVHLPPLLKDILPCPQPKPINHNPVGQKKVVLKSLSDDIYVIFQRESERHLILKKSDQKLTSSSKLSYTSKKYLFTLELQLFSGKDLIGSSKCVLQGGLKAKTTIDIQFSIDRNGYMTYSIPSYSIKENNFNSV